MPFRISLSPPATRPRGGWVGGQGEGAAARVWLSLVCVCALLLAWAMPAWPQAPGKTYRLGFLGSGSTRSHGAFVSAFREEMRARGYVEGKNLTIEYRWAEGDYERLPAMAGELVRLNVDAILAHGTPGTRAAKAATTTIPIVTAIVGDALATGLVASLARPGGNVTGTTFSFADVNAKRVEILKEAVPRVKRVAVLFNDTNAGNVLTAEATARTARTVGVEVLPVSTRGAPDFDRAFAEITRARADAVVVYEDALFIAQAARLAALVERARLPSIGFREYADAGGLLGFGIDFPDVWRRAAGFVDRIFKGARPGDLPMEQAGKFEMAVNKQAARALGVTIPRGVLLRAHTVIE